MKKRLILPLLLAAIAWLPAARADDPFTVVVTSDTLPTLSVGYTKLPDLLNDVLNTRGGFAPYAGTDFSATVSFLGVPEAVLASSNSSGTEVELAIPGINFTRLFTGPDRSGVEKQIQNFFIKDGSIIVGDFLNYIARHSAVAVTDGNPSSSTAIMANQSFISTGFTPSEEIAGAANAEAGPAQANLSGLGIGFNSGRFTANGITGSYNDVAIPFKFRLTDRVSITGALPIEMLDVEGAKVYGAGLNLAVPVRIMIMDKDQPMNWRLSPLTGISARGSADLGGGGAIWMAGLNSSVDYRVSPKLIVCVVDQFTTHNGINVEYAGYRFNPNVDQQMLKDGIRLVTPLSAHLTGDFFVIETDFLKAAAVRNFTTFGTSVSYRLTPTRSLTLGANYDTGSDYRSWSVGLSSAWKF